MVDVGVVTAASLTVQLQMTLEEHLGKEMCDHTQRLGQDLQMEEPIG